MQVETRGSKRTDLTGQRFGRLIVLRGAGVKRYRRCTRPLWLCRCDCGVEKKIMGQSLIQGKTVSCGCHAKEKAATPRLDLAGQRFGRLVAVRRLAKRDGFYEWLCRCDCGNDATVRVTSLISGHTTSCGCLRLERARAANTTHGQAHTAAYIAMKARQRLERKRELDVEWTWEMEEALHELQPACVLCEATEKLSTDHVRPLSAGNGLKPGNAVRLCNCCNSRKHNKLLSDLHPEIRSVLIEAADDFWVYWNKRTQA